MLSLKTSLSQGATGGHPTFHNQPKHTKLPTLAGGEASATMPPPPSAAMVEDDEGVDHQVVSSSSCGAASGSSYESLVDSMRSSSTTTSSSSGMHSSSSNNGGACHGLMKRSSMNKSSYALTSLLAQQPQSPEHQQQVLETLSADNTSTTTTTATTSLASAIAAEARAMKPICRKEFGQTLQTAISQGGTDDDNNNNLNFHNNRSIRQALELPLRQARSLRDSCRRGGAGSSLFDVGGTNGRSSFTSNHPISSTDQLPLSSWVGLPYASLRQELPFLYDHMHTHPLNELLATTLGSDNADHLSQLHQGWDPRKESARDHQRRIFAPLVHDRQRRRAFQEAYDSFVTSCCLPLLHATALRGGVFNSRQHPTVLRNDPVLYRYQVFPTINVVYPNDMEACQPPSCDLSSGKSVGWLHFHIPLTASQGTSALYCEHFPGREDWHALRCSQVGLGYCWDGARCLSFVPLNTTGATRVSLDFRIMLVRASTATAVAAASTTTGPRSMPSLSSRSSMGVGGAGLEDDTLCRTEHLQDTLTRVSGFYKEATMDSFASTASAATGSNGTTLVEPDARCGFPFA